MVVRRPGGLLVGALAKLGALMALELSAGRLKAKKRPPRRAAGRLGFDQVVEAVRAGGGDPVCKLLNMLPADRLGRDCIGIDLPHRGGFGPGVTVQPVDSAGTVVSGPGSGFELGAAIAAD